MDNDRDGEKQKEMLFTVFTFAGIYLKKILRNGSLYLKI